VSSREESQEAGLRAQLDEEYFRGHRLSALQWAALGAVPVWLHARWRVLPDLGAWLAFLFEGFCLAATAGYAAAEHRSGRPAARSRQEGCVAVHVVWTAWDEARSAIWYGLAIASLIPWIAMGIGRPLPPELLSPLGRVAGTLALLALLGETAARTRSRRAGRRPSEDGLRPQWSGRGVRTG
jgi:hypothetical protein